MAMAEGGGRRRLILVLVRSGRQVSPAGSWRRRVHTWRWSHPNSGSHNRPVQNWWCGRRGGHTTVRFEHHLWGAEFVGAQLRGVNREGWSSGTGLDEEVRVRHTPLERPLWWQNKCPGENIDRLCIEEDWHCRSSYSRKQLWFAWRSIWLSQHVFLGTWVWN